MIPNVRCDRRFRQGEPPAPHRFVANDFILYNLHVGRWAYFLFLAASACPAAELPDSYFQQKVAPILAANCSACHSDKVKTSGFSTTTTSSVIGGGRKYG